MELVKLSPYRYQPLLDGPHSIRLLRLKPDIDSAEIRCEIFNYRLRTDRSSGPYEALSYVWGNSEQRRRLFVRDTNLWNGTQAYLDVTTNLLAALRRIRDPDIEKNVWIDAICINQRDIEERGSQVGFMASIYAYASRVIVWLGDGQDDCAAAFGLIREATDAHQRDSHEVPARLNNGCRTCEECKACEKCEACKGCEACKERKSIQQPSRIIRKDADALSGDIHDDKKCVSAEFSSQIMALLYVQWFRRIWVLQEVAAARSVLFMYGAHEIAGGIFCRGLQALKPFYEHDVTLQGLVGSIIRLIDWHPIHDLKKSTRLNILSLHELIDMFQSRCATDPRDKVYALLGMSSDDSDSKTLDADYSKSWPEVFRDLVQMTFGSNVDLSMSTSMGIAFVRVKTYPIGRITYVESNVDTSGRQKLKFELRRSIAMRYKDGLLWNAEWVIECTSLPIKQGDLVCLVQGAYNPTLVRLHDDHCSIILAAMKPPPEVQINIIYNGKEQTTWLCWSEFVQGITCFAADIILVWHWEPTYEQNKGTSSAERERDLTVSIRLKNALENIESEMRRVLNMALLLEFMHDRDSIGKYLEKATQLDTSGNTPTHISTILSKFKTVHRQWDPYLLLKQRLQYDMRPMSRKSSEHDEDMSLVLKRHMQEIGLLETLSALEKGRRGMARFSSSLIDECYNNNWDSHYQTASSKAAQLSLQLLDGFTFSQEDLQSAITLGSGAEMMQMIIRHQPDDIQVFESNIKTVIRTTVFDSSMLELIIQPLRGVSISEDIIITTAQQTTPLSFKTILNRSDSSCISRITLAVVHAIARNRHCGLQLLKIALEHEKQNLPCNPEVLDTMSQNTSGGRSMLTFLFVMTQEVNVFLWILDILAAVPASQLKDDFSFCGPTRTRHYYSLISYYQKAKRSRRFEFRSDDEIYGIIYDHFDYTTGRVRRSLPPSRLRKDVELHAVNTVIDIILG